MELDTLITFSYIHFFTGAVTALLMAVGCWRYEGHRTKPVEKAFCVVWCASAMIIWFVYWLVFLESIISVLTEDLQNGTDG